MSCPIPTLLEKQKQLMCGKHAINNLLQDNLANCKNLKAIGKRLSTNYGVNLNELIDNATGYYDVSVLFTFLNEMGYDVSDVPRVKFESISRRQSNRLIGYIFGNGVHWVAVRKTQNIGCYFEIDSLHDQPIKIKVIKNWLLHNKQLIAIKVLRPK